MGKAAGSDLRARRVPPAHMPYPPTGPTHLPFLDHVWQFWTNNAQHRYFWWKKNTPARNAADPSNRGWKKHPLGSPGGPLGALGGLRGPWGALGGPWRALGGGGEVRCRVTIRHVTLVG